MQKLAQDYADKQMNGDSNVIDFLDQKLASVGVDMPVFQSIINTLDKIPLLQNVSLNHICAEAESILIDSTTSNFKELSDSLYDGRFKLEQNSNLKIIESSLHCDNPKTLIYSVNTEHTKFNPVLKLYIFKE
ncbi:MAG: hypothetical protein ABIB43_00500 [archaeon]